MSERPRPVVAAEAAFAEGRPWEARDRLTGYMAHHPDDRYAQALLGDAWWQLGDPVRAGRSWFLTDRDGPEVTEAVSALRESSPAVEIARSLRVAEDPDSTYAGPALARLSWLAGEVAAEGGIWAPGSPVRVPSRDHRPVHKRLRAARNRVLVAALLLATVGVWLIGVFAIGHWLA